MDDSSNVIGGGNPKLKFKGVSFIWNALGLQGLVMLYAVSFLGLVWSSGMPCRLHIYPFLLFIKAHKLYA